MSLLVTQFLKDLIAKNLSAFVENFDAKQIQQLDFSGVHLTNAQLRLDILQGLNLPFRLKQGLIGFLHSLRTPLTLPNCALQHGGGNGSLSSCIRTS